MSDYIENPELNEEESNNVEQTMQDVLDEALSIEVGDTVKGEVLSIQDRQAIVGIIGGGVEGVIPYNELSAKPFDEVTEILNVGDVVDLVVIKQIKDKENGSFLLSKRRVDAKIVWKDIQDKFENNEIIEAPVKDVVKGGLVVDVGVRGFVPASMVEDHFVEDFSSYKGKVMTFKIVELEPSENRLILSHKAVVETEKEANKGKLMDELVAGDIVEGTVARLTNFGAFVDLGGVDGLVHISQIAHEHVKNPGDVLAIGQAVKVKILSIDKENGRVSLSIKDTLAGPWNAIAEKAPIGAVLTGVVKRLTSFGAFVEVFPGVEGLVHISQISHQHIATPHEVLQEGQEIQVKVLDAKEDEQRLSLSIKALEEKAVNEAPAAEEKREKKEKKTEEYVADDSDGNFTLADLLGDKLSGLKDDSEA
ncbi:30S ribosomal protein S1 [Trichococcus shcherbakoviae]|uniref:30S ribosomal protein S1 n=1 Tax=Trichococcus shcherbakoviae subsp. psychrophilus TaxID=2585775 RepID=A0A5C5E802_9LACT|nr:30S ribosomal protein S1 [Trichococcus shcherbakoviae]OUL09561.1 30S ribosomal protein S1 [Sedimentibacter sp. SX930]TNV69152.1 30S ribosomal protein S1 [Trichococcus shcherbakoviae subsp. psychrophilus]